MNPQRTLNAVFLFVAFMALVAAPLYVDHVERYDACVNSRRLLYIKGDEAWFHGLRRAEKLHNHGWLYYHLRDVTYHDRQTNLDAVDATKC